MGVESTGRHRSLTELTAREPCIRGVHEFFDGSKKVALYEVKDGGEPTLFGCLICVGEKIFLITNGEAVRIKNGGSIPCNEGVEAKVLGNLPDASLKINLEDGVRVAYCLERISDADKAALESASKRVIKRRAVTAAALAAVLGLGVVAVSTCNDDPVSNAVDVEANP